MRAVVYTRVSSDKAKGRSVTEQEQECRAECDRRGWTVAEVLCDNDRSATRFATKSRPEYQRLQQILRKGDVLVTWEASRAQRDLKAYVALRDLCAERGVMWSYSGALFDLSKADDRFRTGLDALRSEDEAEKTRERVLRAHRANLDAGRPHGQRPFGYRIVRDPDTGKPVERVPDEIEAPMLRDAARRVLAGESLKSVAARLNTWPEPPSEEFSSRGNGQYGEDGSARRQWRPNNLRRMLASPVYAGYRTHKGQAVREGTWRPILTADEHDRLVALFSNRVVPRGSAPNHLLSGIAECAVCGGRLYVRSNGYGCDHGHVGRAEAKVDRAVTQVITALLSDPVNLAKLAAPLPADSAPDDSVKALQERLDAAAAAYESGKLSLELLSRLEARMLPKIKAAAQRERDAERDRFLAPVVAKVATAPDPHAVWKSLPLEGKRDFIRATMRITVHPVRSRWELGVQVHPIDRKAKR